MPLKSVVTVQEPGSLVSTIENGAYNLHWYIYVDTFMLKVYINKHKACLKSTAIKICFQKQ